MSGDTLQQEVDSLRELVQEQQREIKRLLQVVWDLSIKVRVAARFVNEAVELADQEADPEDIVDNRSNQASLQFGEKHG